MRSRALLQLVLNIFSFLLATSSSNEGRLQNKGLSNAKNNERNIYYSSFVKDVIQPIRQKVKEHSIESLMNIIMEEAKPLAQFNAELIANGQTPLEAKGDNSDFKFVEMKNQKQRYLDEAEYTYNVDDNYARDFSSYSFKYAKCQAIQRFSQEAAGNGEYSALVTDYMVVFRFCPTRSCSSSNRWGCSSGYGDYVIKLNNYLKAMMYYQVSNRENLCPFCQNCGFTDDYFEGERRLEDNQEGNDENDGDDDGADDGADDDDANDYYAADDDGGNNDDDDYVEQKSYSDECLAYDYLCDGYTSWCYYGNDDDMYKDSLDYLDYIEYFECVNVNDGGYWVAPRCDSDGNIDMGIFYDPYCSQYAGNEVNLKKVTGLNFVKNIFTFTYDKHCKSCDQYAGAPYYGTTHNFCNRVYSDAGKCNEYLAYAFNDDEETSSSDNTCSYIENIHYGVYDENGEIYISGNSKAGRMKTEVTTDQKIFLGIMGFSVACLALYSCFLHHEITNLLLHKLSYQGSLAPGKRHRGSKGKGNRRSHDREDDVYFSYTEDSSFA